MTPPSVSICIPAYHADEFLPATLESVRAQTYANWELIVTEDGSTGGTEALVHAFAATVGQRVIYSRHAVNRGLAATRNTGVGQALGGWIAFLDADDLWAPTHLEELLSIAQTSRAEVACSAAVAFDSVTGAMVREMPHADAHINDFPRSLYHGEITVLPSSAMVDRDTLMRSGAVNLKYRICNDTELWFRLASKGARFAFTQNPTCRYRRHAGSLTHRQAPALAELGRLYDEYAGWSAIPRRDRRGKAASLYRYAGRTLLGENSREARALLWESLKRDWVHVSTWYFLAKSLLSRSQKARSSE